MNLLRLNREVKPKLQAVMQSGQRLRIARLRNLNHRLSSVKANKPKQLTGLNQKVCSWLFLSTVGIHGQKTVGVEVKPKLSVVNQVKHGKPVLPPKLAGKP